MGTAKAYLFRVFSHSHTSYSISEEYKYEIPDDVKRRAVTAGLIGGILFFIVAIILSVCTVKICNKKRRRKQERGKFAFTHYAFHLSSCQVNEIGMNSVSCKKCSTLHHRVQPYSFFVYRRHPKIRFHFMTIQS